MEDASTMTDMAQSPGRDAFATPQGRAPRTSEGTQTFPQAYGSSHHSDDGANDALPQSSQRSSQTASQQVSQNILASPAPSDSGTIVSTILARYGYDYTPIDRSAIGSYASNSLGGFERAGIWQYRDDEGEWKDYDVDAAEVVDLMWQQWKTDKNVKVYAVISGDRKYSIDFNSMTQQRRRRHKQTERPVRRLDPPPLPPIQFRSRFSRGSSSALTSSLSEA
eukprot:Sspe_Gene.33673::Locus_16420_Transcript_1_1_Confidence_1.000_Length_1107::g.33673::m.33673